MDLHEVSGAGGTVVLSGVTLSLRELSVGDLSQLGSWLKERLPKPFDVVRDALLALQPLREVDPIGYEDSRKDLLLRAREDAMSGSSIDPQQAMSMIQGIPGIAYALFLSTRLYHPNLDYEHIKNLMDGEDLSTIKDKLDTINAAWTKIKNPPAAPTPAV